MSTITTPEKQARESIWSLFIGGIFVAIIGVVMANQMHPETTISSLGLGTSDTGSEFGYLAGLIVAGLGSTMTSIAVVAWGVSLGMRASR